MAEREDSSWLNLSHDEGVGTTIVLAKADGPHTGRIDRIATRTVTKKRNNNQKMVKFLQKGKSILDVNPRLITYPKTGGVGNVTIRTNAGTLSGIITSITGFPTAQITSVVVDGVRLNIDGGSQSWQYAIAGDPGRDREYIVQLEVKMPPNDKYGIKSEVLTFNGEIVQLIQESVGDYLDIDRYEDFVGGESGSISIEIKSNTEYKIEIVECNETAGHITLNPTSVELDYMGSPKKVDVIASNKTEWRAN